MRNPFEGDVIVKELTHGTTLAQAVASCGLDPDTVELFIAGNNILQKHWHVVRPRPGVAVDVRAAPGIGGLISIISTAVGTIATSAATALGVTGGISILGTSLSFAGAIGVGVSFALQAGLTSLFAPKPPGNIGRANQADSPERFGIQGTRNEQRPYGAVPIVLGTYRISPDYGASPYTEVVGDDQYIRGILVWGYGPIVLSDIRIGNAAISGFEGVELEHDLDGTATAFSLYPITAAQTGLNIVLTDSYQSFTTDIDTDEIGVTVEFPNGLFRLDEQGLRVSQSVTVTAQYRPVGGSWVSWFSDTITRNENSVVRFSRRVAGLTRGSYEVRMLRSAASGDTRVQDACQWSSIRAFTGGNPVTLPGIAKTAFRIKATGQASGVIDQINGLVSLKVPTWDGDEWTGYNVSDNPAAIYRYILTGAANRRAVGSSRVADDVIGDWSEYCATRGYRYSTVLKNKRSVGDLLNEVAASGMASPQMIDDAWGVAIDRAQTTVVQHFTPRNANKFSGEVLSPLHPHALRVQFANEDRDYQQDERTVYADGYSAANATKFEVISAPGIVDAANAYRFGRHFLAAGLLRPELFKFDVGFENLICRRGDLVRLTYDVALIGQSAGRIKSISGNNVTLDEFCTFEADKTYSLRVRTSLGVSISQAATAAGVGSYLTVTLPDASSLAAGDLFAFGETTKESILAIVKEIRAGGDLSATITCIPYNEEVYSTADTVPPYVSNLSLPVSLSAFGPATPVINNVVSDESAVPRNFEGVPQPTILLYVSAGIGDPSNPRITEAREFDIFWRKSGTDNAFESLRVPVSSKLGRINGVESGVEYEIEVQAVDDRGGRSNRARLFHRVSGFSAKPPALGTLRVSTQGGQAYLEWTYPSIVSDVVGYEIRYHPDTDVTDWSRMTIIGDQVPRSARSITIPSRLGSYAVKPVDVLGGYSVDALYVNSTMTDAQSSNEVVTITENPDFDEVRTNLVTATNGLILSPDTTLADWPALSEVQSMLAPTADSGFDLSGNYEFGEFDMGGIYTVRVEANLNVLIFDLNNTLASWGPLGNLGPIGGGATGDEHRVEVQVAWSTADSETPVWGDWQRFSVVDLTARHVKFRVVVETLNKRSSPIINTLSVALTMPTRVETGEDVVSGAATKTVTITPPFYLLKTIGVTSQDMQTGDYMVIENKAAGSFDVTFRNSAGVVVDRTFDWQAVGIGQEVA